MTRPCRVCPNCGEGKREQNQWCRSCAPKMARRLPLAPLAEAAHTSVSGLMRRLGVNGTDAKRYRAEGVPEALADAWACKLGFHPAEVWGDEWYAGCIDESDAA